MLRALILALADMADRRLLPLWVKSVLATLLIFALLAAAGWNGLMILLRRHLYVDGFSELAAGLVVILGLWLLWRIIAIAVLQFFADDVVIAIERRDYPEKAASARKLGLHEEARRALAGAGRALVWNLVALPVALALAITGIGAPLVFLLVNAALLGRELEDMVWLRHRASPDSPPPLSALQRLILGGTVAILFTIPLANFIAPFLGAACAVHLIYRKRAPRS